MRWQNISILANISSTDQLQMIPQPIFFVSHKHIYIQPFIENSQTHFRIYHDQIQEIDFILKILYGIMKYIYVKHINEDTNYSIRILPILLYHIVF